jgi:drug/metabolite transporter (DMT)-like permease
LTLAPHASDRRRALLADAALLSVAVVWGFNFIVIKDAIGATGPMTYLLWRHVVAALMLVVVMPRTVRQVRRADWLYGAVLGLFLFVAFATQTIGLQWTTPGKNGFITSLDIVMVPFLFWLIARRSPGWVQIGGALLAVAGLGSLTLHEGLSMGKGDLLTLVCALGFAAQITATGFFAPRTRPALLALTQVAAAAVLFVAATPFMEHVGVGFGWKGWTAIVWTAVSGTLYGFIVQAWALKSTSSTHAAVVLGLEGLFAGVFGVAFGRDVLTWRFALGGALILVGVLLIELAPSRPGERVAPVAAIPRLD